MRRTVIFILFFAFVPFFSSAQNITIDEVIYGLIGEPFRETQGGWGPPFGKHEGILNRVPSSYDWYSGARGGGGWRKPEDFQGINIWGQAYVEDGGSPETNYRIQVRNLISFKYLGEAWEMIEETANNVGGYWYKENFDNGTAQGNKRFEPQANGGGMSATMIPGHTFHWWTDTWPRAQMPHGFEAIHARCEVRLIPDTDPDVDLSQVKVLVGLGMDAYTTRDHSAGSNERITSMLIGRMQYVTSEWMPLGIYICGDPVQLTYENYIDNVFSRPLPPGIAPSTKKNPIKIMPVGGSIAEQTPGYRGFLQQLLDNEGSNYEFVGSKDDGNGLKHAGYAGYVIGPDVNIELDANSTFDHLLSSGAELLNIDADVWLMNIGKADFFNQSGYDPDVDGATRLDDLIGKVFVANPNLTLLLSNLSPKGDDENFAVLFNAQVPDVVQKYRELGYRIFFVDILNDPEWNLSEDISTENIHPTATGYEKKLIIPGSMQ